jgi:predicted PhzF superfamily epimerase YddE/YHI9
MKVRILRAFTTSAGSYGNPLGVVEDGSSLPGRDSRIALAKTLGFSESVVIDDIENADVRFYSDGGEVPFAGHAAVGVAWFIAQVTGTPPRQLRTAGGDAPCWSDEGITWVRSALRATPPWWHERLDSPEAVERLAGPLVPEQDMTQLWAWMDEQASIMRVRTFVRGYEDEACGSGAMRMAAAFGRHLTLHHGKGSIMYAKPGPPGYADVGGMVVEDFPRNI